MTKSAFRLAQHVEPHVVDILFSGTVHTSNTATCRATCGATLSENVSMLTSATVHITTDTLQRQTSIQPIRQMNSAIMTLQTQMAPSVQDFVAAHLLLVCTTVRTLATCQAYDHDYCLATVGKCLGPAT